MRFVIAIALSALLAACASAPTAPPVEQALVGHAPAGPIVVATLATNACEMVTAPVYTAATVAAQRAGKALRERRLTVATAETVLVLGQRARADLDAACPDPNTVDATRLAAAESAVRQMQALLGGVQ